MVFVFSLAAVRAAVGERLCLKAVMADIAEIVVRVYPEFCVNFLRECKQQKLV